MIELTEQQRQQLESGQAVEVTDGQTARSYVVLGKDLFDRVRRLLYDDSEWTEDELRLQLARSAAANGWDEPGMEAYERYDEERGQRYVNCTQCPRAGGMYLTRLAGSGPVVRFPMLVRFPTEKS
jgi:hypothetical protein